MAETIKATFSFTLGTEKTNAASAEIDTRIAEEGGDNAIRLGKTADFEPGEKIGFLIDMPDTLEVDYVKTSMDEYNASTSDKGDTNVIVNNEELHFEIKGSTATLSKHANSLTPNAPITSGKWIGNKNFGILTLQDDRVTVKMAPDPSLVIKTEDSESERNRKIKESRKPGIYRIKTYNSKRLLWELNTPTKDSLKPLGPPPYPVDVNIYLKPKIKPE